MTQLIKKKPSDYSLHILNNYPEHAKIKFVDQTFNDKNYDNLSMLFDAMEDPYLIIGWAFDLLDIEAITLIVAKAKLRSDGAQELAHHCNLKLLLNRSSTIDFTGEMNSAEENAKAFEMIKLLLEFQNEDTLSKEILEILTHFLTQQEFKAFIKLKTLDLTQEEFRGLDLSIYEFESLEPILFKKHSVVDYILKKPIPSLLDLLLSRTYSDQLSVEEVSNIYRKLYELSPISKEMITYVAVLISKGNNIKIIFDEAVDSGYLPTKNIIYIDTKVMRDTIDNIESSVIHEAGHYIYEQLFKNNVRPFSFEELAKFTKLYKAELNDPYLQDSSVYKYFYNNTRIEEVKKILDETIEYEKEAKKPLEMAAKILKVNIKDFDKHVDSNDLAEYFKDHSYIDLFYLNLTPWGHADVLDNIYNIYLAYSNRDPVLFNDIDCPGPIKTYNLYEPSDMQWIVTWATEELLPQMVVGFNLSNTQIHFLERMADYVNRGTHILSEKGREEDDYERHVELTVRGQELRAIVGMEPEIIESFEGLEQIHLKTASPKICEFILSSEVASLSFDGEMIGQTYTCLSV